MLIRLKPFPNTTNQQEEFGSTIYRNQISYRRLGNICNSLNMHWLTSSQRNNQICIMYKYECFTVSWFISRNKLADFLHFFCGFLTHYFGGFTVVDIMWLVGVRPIERRGLSKQTNYRFFLPCRNTGLDIPSRQKKH